MSRDRLTIDDIRAAGHCARGAHAWFKLRGLDFRKFLREGMSIEDARALGDGHANKILDRKAARS